MTKLITDKKLTSTEKAINSFYEDKGDAILALGGVKKDDQLGYIPTIKDEIIVKMVNGDPSMREDICLFNECENIGGTPFGKRIVLSMFNRIQESEFRDNADGQKIYEAYVELKRNLNVNLIEINEKIVYDEEVLKNCFYYLLLASSPEINSTKELSQSLVSIISCTNTQLIRYIDFPVIIDNTEEVLEDIKTIKEEAISEIKSIEKNKQSYLRSMGKGIYNMVKSSLSGDAFTRGLQLTVYTGVAVWTGNYILGMISAKLVGKVKDGDIFRKDQNREIESDKETDIGMERESDENSEVRKAFKDLIIAIYNYCIKKI
jgi:hypothetical protein